jgi:GNAT superfamily N-acetyltransferase
MGGRGTGLSRDSSKFSGTAGGGGGVVGFGATEQALARKIFGKNISADDIRELSGAASFSGAKVQVSSADGQLTVRVLHKAIVKETDDGGGMIRTFYKDRQGAKIRNDAFFLKESAQGKGLGGKALYLQKEAATKLGVKEINLTALRDGRGSVGHKVWGDLGFDGKLSVTQKANWQRANPMEGLMGKKPPNTVRELYDRRGGREFWNRHAEAFTKMTMKLGRGSKSVKVLDAYAAKKGWR